jgi:hypothetical protein
MESTINPAALAECVVPLDDEGRRAVRRYWERVIREEWVPPVRRVRRPVPLAEDGRRERRAARRAVARIAAAGRTVQVHALDTARERPGFGGEAA